MRILLINGNTTQFVTDTVAAEARLSASPQTEIVPVTGRVGPQIIATRVENAIAEREIIALAALHAASVDAVVLAVSTDPALPALREMLTIPVVGMSEAAFLTAHMLGGTVGCITLGARLLPVYRELVRAYGLDARVSAWRNVQSRKPFTPGEADEADFLLVEAANDLVERDGAEVVVLLGAVTAGAPRRLRERVPVPLLDGIACGVRQAELLVGLDARAPQTGSFAAPGARPLSGIEPEIVDHMARAAES